MDAQQKPTKVLAQVADDPASTNSDHQSGITQLAVISPQPRPKQEIINPKTATLDWGWFPEIIVPEHEFKAGAIRLRYGTHRGPNNGYGLEHIWAAHFKSAASTPMLAIDAIADFLAAILTSGASIFYEYGNGRASHRTTVFRSRKGIVIVEERQDGQGKTFYPIVTAFPGRQAHGVLIGKI
jgi:hypothetical protein